MERIRAEEVKRARKALGMTQREFAVRVGRTERTVLKWEQEGAGLLEYLAIRMVLVQHGHQPTGILLGPEQHTGEEQ